MRPGEVVDNLQALQIDERRRVRIGSQHVETRDRNVAEARARDEEQLRIECDLLDVVGRLVGAVPRHLRHVQQVRPDDPFVLGDERLRFRPRVGRPERNRLVLIDLRAIPRIAARQRVRGGDGVVNLADGVVLVRRRRHLHRVDAGRAGLTPIRLGVQEQIRPRDRVDIGPRTCCVARHRRDGGHPAILPQPFVAAEEERLILDDRAAQIAAKLVALQRWNVLAPIVEVGA